MNLITIDISKTDKAVAVMIVSKLFFTLFAPTFRYLFSYFEYNDFYESFILFEHIASVLYRDIECV